MKHCAHLGLMILMLSASTGCQTSTKSKPLTNLSKQQQLEMFKYTPITEPEKKGYDWDNIYRDTALVVVSIPVFVAYGLAQSGAHFSVGK
jgi:hypothetical protein